jgi:hypothetical protein
MPQPFGIMANTPGIANLPGQKVKLAGAFSSAKYPIRNMLISQLYQQFPMISFGISGISIFQRMKNNLHGRQVL